MLNPSFLILLLLLARGASLSTEGPAEDPSDVDRTRCFDVLTHALAGESLGVRVHGAEALTSLGRPEPVLEAFRPQAESTEPVTRILVWRVLAAAEPEPAARRKYVERIRAAFVDPASPDRTHAVESLAKLGEPITDAERPHIRAISDEAGPSSPFALWRLVQAGEADAVARLAERLHSRDDVTRFRSAYVLGQIRSKYPVAEESLAAALATEPPDSSSRPMLFAAASSKTARDLFDDDTTIPSDRYFAAMFLADAGDLSDLPRLAGVLHHHHIDLRVSAAYAALKIKARSTRTTTPSPRRSPPR
jgi:SSS family solute:Na+ symporter